MNIKSATLNDLPQIVSIYNQAISVGGKTADTAIFSVQQRLAWFESHQPTTFPLLVAVEQDQVVGYLTISPYRNARPAVRKTAEVSYYIHFQHHRKGIASRLLDYAIQLCPRLRLETLVALLISHNQGSIQLLKKQGFEQWACLPNIVHINGQQFDHLYYGLHLT